MVARGDQRGFVYNSDENAAVAPFGGTAPRPEFIASRDFTPV
jgi:ectoine hydroxylase